MTTRRGARRTIAVMTQSFSPLPQHHSERREIGTGRVLAWVILVGLAFVPRLWIVGFWIFSKTIGQAFSSWIIPALGFVILPWTTLMYAWMWSINSHGVHGWEWWVVAVSFLLDLVVWLGGRRSLQW
jgi:hypothetical protein